MSVRRKNRRPSTLQDNNQQIDMFENLHKGDKKLTKLCICKKNPPIQSRVDISNVHQKLNHTLQSSLHKFEKRINRLTNICLAAVSDQIIIYLTKKIFLNSPTRFCVCVEFFSRKTTKEFNQTLI